MLTKNILVLAAFILAISGLARAADLTGKWSTEFDSQIGVQKYSYEFKNEGKKLSGKATFERSNGKGDVDLKDIKLKDDDVSFVEPLKFNDQEITITYKGKITGDEMKLTREVGDFGTEQIVVKRVKASAAPAPAAAAKP